MRVRRKIKPPLLAVYHGIVTPGFDLDKAEPNYYCTRIWIGCVPPEDIDGETYPGYACVVGEKFDGDPSQRDRTRVVLDEGIALDPADFSKRERQYHGIRDNALEYPTLYTLRDAVIALKDIYWAERIYVPPGNEQFKGFIQSTDGLYSYDPRYGDARYNRQMPFYVSRRRTCREGILQVENEQRQHNISLVSSLLDMDRLTIDNDCTLFWDRQLPTARRAIGLVCAEMQMMDMTYQIREMHMSDGYDEYEEKEEDKEQKDGAMSEAEDIAWWANSGNAGIPGGSGWLG